MWHNTRLLNAVASALYALLALGGLGVGAVWLMQRPMFQLQQVRVMPMVGSEMRHVNAPSLRANALVKLRGNFFTLNLDDARQAFVAAVAIDHTTFKSREDFEQALQEVLEARRITSVRVLLDDKPGRALLSFDRKLPGVNDKCLGVELWMRKFGLVSPLQSSVRVVCRLLNR